MTVNLRYFAQLREIAGVANESFSGDVHTTGQLWQAIAVRHGFRLEQKLVKVAVNDQYRDWEFPLSEGAQVVFIPPVAGG